MASHFDALRTALRSGPLDAPNLCKTLGISQPTFSRLIKQADSGIVRYGKARASRYGLLRTVRGLGTTLPLFRIGLDGASAPYGSLTALHGDWYLFERHGSDDAEAFEGLPYFCRICAPKAS